MLVLSRKKDERIVIGDNIEIVVVDVRGDKVRLGINATSEVPVHRREVWVAIQQQAGETHAQRTDSQNGSAIGSQRNEVDSRQHEVPGSNSGTGE